MKKRTTIAMLFFAALLIFSMTPSAHAILSAISTDPATGALLTDPANGFPMWYQDAAGTALAPCLDPNPSNCVVLPDIGTFPGANYTGGAPTFPTNFPSEFFYFIADADKTLFPASIKVGRFALEGSFANVPPVPTAGQQAVFMRIRFRFTPPVATGTYTVTHPYGVNIFTPPFDPKKGVNFTQDVPAPIPGNFTAALNGPIGPFLTWDPADQPGVLPNPGFISNYLIPHKVIGSPKATNFFQIDGPDIGGPGVNTFRTDFFNVAGKTAVTGVQPTPLIIDRATFSRALTGTVTVSAHSNITATLAVSGGPNLPATPVPMTGDGLGAFFVAIPLTNASVLPPTISVTSTGGAGTTPTTLSAPLTDIVTITRATFNIFTPPGGSPVNVLTVQASSSDQFTRPPILSAPGFGNLVGGTLTVNGVAVPPGTITVTSTSGGSASVPITVVNVPVVNETITITQAQFVRSKNAWFVQGTSNIVGGAGVFLTFHLGDANGPVIGTTAVDAKGQFKFQTTVSSPALIPDTVNKTVTAVSVNGNIASRAVVLK